MGGGGALAVWVDPGEHVLSREGGGLLGVVLDLEARAVAEGVDGAVLVDVDLDIEGGLGHLAQGDVGGRVRGGVEVVVVGLGALGHGFVAGEVGVGLFVLRGEDVRGWRGGGEGG